MGLVLSRATAASALEAQLLLFIARSQRKHKHGSAFIDDPHSGRCSCADGGGLRNESLSRLFVHQENDGSDARWVEFVVVGQDGTCEDDGNTAVSDFFFSLVCNMHVVQQQHAGVVDRCPIKTAAESLIMLFTFTVISPSRHTNVSITAKGPQRRGTLCLLLFHGMVSLQDHTRVDAHLRPLRLPLLRHSHSQSAQDRSEFESRHPFGWFRSHRRVL